MMRKSLTVDHEDSPRNRNGRSRISDKSKDFHHQLSTPMLLINGEDMDDDSGNNMSIDSGNGGASLDLLTGMEDLSCTGSEGPSSLESVNFDKIIGAIEDIVVGDEFQALQNFYLSKHWMKFDDKDLQQEVGDGDMKPLKEVEHNHEHFKIFKDYSQEMAHLLETQLKKAIGEFNMEAFVEELTRRSEEAHGKNPDDDNSMLEGEIFEMLFTLTDFVKFKELFVDYRHMMEGKTPNLTTGITLKSLNSPRSNSSNSD